MRLIAPNGSDHYISDGERRRIDQMLAAGYTIPGAEAAPAASPAPPAPAGFTASDMTVIGLRTWLQGEPPKAHAKDIFVYEQQNKHRKTALDLLQDYIANG